jgi:hypothetical protein
VTALRAVLAEVLAGEADLARLAGKLGIGADEVEAMVDYWVRRGRLAVQPLGPACPSRGCATCPVAAAQGSDRSRSRPLRCFS